MFGPASTTGPTLASSPTTSTPTSPTRSGRLRGLSYLRNYTHSGSSTIQPTTAAITSPSASTDDAMINGDVMSNHRHSISSSPTSSNKRTPAQRDTDFLTPQRSVTEGGPRPGRTSVDSGPTRSSSAASPSGLRNRSPLSAVPTIVPTPTVSAGTESTVQPASALSSSHGNPTSAKDTQPSIRMIPYQEGRSSRPSLPFPIVTRSVPTSSSVIRVGRYSERDNHGAGSGCTVAPVGFKSKVVSRNHCEFWCTNNQWYIKDCKSSSGTFLNHIRLSSPGIESRPYPVNDGDIVQLGIDFKGGEEVIFRCVKIKVECNRGWQKGLNEFNTSTHKRLRDLAKAPASPATPTKDDDTKSVNTSECSICLNPVAPCQALFVAPCSHVWHFKCIRPLILPNWPSFQCPNCRGFSDLDADVEQPELFLDDEGSASDPELREVLRSSAIDVDRAVSAPVAIGQAGLSRPDTSEQGDDSLLDDMNILMSAAHLRDEQGSSDSQRAGSNDNDTAASPNPRTPSIPIQATRARSQTRTMSNDMIDAANPLSATPTSTAPFAMADILAYSSTTSVPAPTPSPLTRELPATAAAAAARSISATVPRDMPDNVPTATNRAGILDPTSTTETTMTTTTTRTTPAAAGPTV